MDAVLLAVSSAALFGGMTVALRPALAGGASAELGALWTVITATAVALAAAVVRFDPDVSGLWPFALAGLLGPGLSQTFFTLAVKNAGPARASVTVGTAPLFAVAIALVFFDEPLVAGVFAGAILIVGGGFLLVAERDRPSPCEAHRPRVRTPRHAGLRGAGQLRSLARGRYGRESRARGHRDARRGRAGHRRLGAGHATPHLDGTVPRSSLPPGSSSASPTSVSSRRTTEEPSRSSHRSSRPSRSGECSSPPFSSAESRSSASGSRSAPRWSSAAES